MSAADLPVPVNVDAADDPPRVVDAHHHLWDLGTGRYPWLQGPRQSPDDLSGIGPFQRTYRVGDLLAAAAGVPLIASVHVEAAWDADSPTQETRWLQSVAGDTGFPQAIVAAAHLEDPHAARILDEHLASENVRGVRQMLDWDPRPGAAQPPKLLGDPDWVAGLALLAPRNLSFDLQVLPNQLGAAARVVRRYPDTVFILDHGGYHMARDPAAECTWRAGIQLLAACPNVCVKTSGYDAVDRSWAPAGFRMFIRTLVEAFGPDRTMFASNFPIDARGIHFPQLVALCRWALDDLTKEERDAFFAATAAQIYRLTLPSGSPVQPHRRSGSE